MCCIIYSISQKTYFLLSRFLRIQLFIHFVKPWIYGEKSLLLSHYPYHKVLTYIEYRAVSGVFRTTELLIPHPPLHPASVSSPSTKGGRVHTRRAVRGWGVNISEDAWHWIGLLQYNPSTTYIFSSTNRWGMMLANEARLLKWICTR
jgi:hypothetical protein